MGCRGAGKWLSAPQRKAAVQPALLERRFCPLQSQSPLVAGFQRKGASGSAGELTTPGICNIALQGNHQEPGLSMVLAAANFMGFWD